MAIAAKAKEASYAFHYLSCRNISAPEDDRAGRKIYSGHAPASTFLGLEDNENVREYLVDAPGKARRAPTLVHQAIRKTLANNIDDFSILNGGMVIVARSAEVDDKNRVIALNRPSIINGSQTQGELKRYFASYEGKPEVNPSIKFELIVTDDDDLIAEISIARNFQNDVRAISIAGRRGQLDDLEAAMQRTYPDAKLRKSETDVSTDDFLDTEKLIQVIFAMMPHEIFSKLAISDSKVFTYSQKARCLKTFQRIVDESEGELADVYKFCLDIAGSAWNLYEKWKSNQGFYGSRLRSIQREGSTITDIPDGIIFPILAALSVFVKRVGRKGWQYCPPDLFDQGEVIDAAVQAYKEIADSNPWVMGKSKACYSTLHRVTSIYARLAS
ncbi:MAG: AIPR family protein [Betaproteobacteria bacterium]|nr:AIPR family protein [Betaproteobacteria bacterium]